MNARMVKTALLTVLALLLLPVAAASASSAYNLTGTWEVHNTAGPGADGTETLSMPDTASGAFTGEFAGFPIHGTANGTVVQFEIGEAPGYVSYNEDTVEYKGTTLVMHGHWHDTGAQSGEYVETLQGGYTPGGGSGEGSGSESGSGGSSSVTISCDAYNPGNPLEYFKCTGQVAGNGGAALPTGTLTFSSNEGGFPLGSTCNLQPGSGASSCTVTFYPGYGAAVTIKAAYSGDANYKAASGERGLQPDLGQDPSRALEVEACALLYSLSCRGLLPKPDPVQTCISLVENCNGFGGTKNAEPGTIDMSGFPSSLITKAGCEQSAKNPFKRVAAAASGSSGGSGGANVCKIGGILEGEKIPPGTRLTSEEGAYLFNLAMFRSSADNLRSTLVGEIGRLPDQFKVEEDAVTLFEAHLVGWLRQVNQIIDQAKEEGKPVNPRWAVGDDCVAIFTAGDLAAACSAGLKKFNAAMYEDLEKLKAMKHELGVDVPYKGSKAWLRADVSSAGRHHREKKSRHLFAYAYGKVSLKPGRHGKLRLKVGAPARKLLRRAAHHGDHTVPATLMLTATQGTVTTTRHVHVTLLLRHGKQRRAHHG